MKKVILFAAFAVVAFATQAQTEKSTWLLGGSAGFSSSKTGDFKTTSFSFAPNAGYFVMDNLAVGAGIGFQSQKDEGDDAVSLFSANPFVRYYFTKLGENAKLFGNANFGVGSAKSGGDSQSFTQWGIAAGPAIFLNKNTALEMTVGYSSVKVKDAVDATGTFGVNVGFQIHFGGK
ncbi:MAG: porin family protein [Ferruginibacter sp.]|nr:porin family protein [Ferruginibacter sp.]